MWDVLGVKSDTLCLREVQIAHGQDIGSLKASMSVLLQGQQVMMSMLDRLVASEA